LKKSALKHQSLKISDYYPPPTEAGAEEPQEGKRGRAQQATHIAVESVWKLVTLYSDERTQDGLGVKLSRHFRAHRHGRSYAHHENSDSLHLFSNIFLIF
jgi:hypothetical protein